MVTQRPLFPGGGDEPPKKKKKKRRKTDKKRIERAFRLFDQQHPEVYSMLVELAKYAKSRGQDRWGMKALFEKVRWEMRVERGDNSFALNNNYHSYYARKIMQQFPEFKDFFEIRELSAQEPVFSGGKPLEPGPTRDQMEGIP